MKGFAIQSTINPDIGFALYVHDSDYDEAKECIEYRELEIGKVEWM